MKFLIVGTGGTGGSIGSFLALNKEDVTFISRGQNLKLMKANGVQFNSTIKGKHTIKNASVVSESEYNENADVIFVCVKGYSVEEIIPIIKKASHKDTIIIPIMNGYNMSEKIANNIDIGHVLEGCIYISAFVDQPGSITQLGPLFKIVFGKKSKQVVDQDKLLYIKRRLEDSGIVTILSETIESDTFKKFTFISAYAACGAYYDVDASGMLVDGEARKTAILLTKEIASIGNALKLDLDVDITESFLSILES